MPARDRIRRYRESGGAADLVRVEVLVPASGRAEILTRAQEIRTDHRRRKERLQVLIDDALGRYRLRVLDNIDIDRVTEPDERARIIAQALIARGDARAFAIGRRILDELGAELGE